MPLIPMGANKMFKILIADSLPASVLEAYNQLEDVQVDNRSGISAEELAEVLGTYDGLVVRSRTKVTADLLEKPGKLKIIGRAGAGVDNIDTKAATHRGIIVIHSLSIWPSCLLPSASL